MDDERAVHRFFLSLMAPTATISRSAWQPPALAVLGYAPSRASFLTLQEPLLITLQKHQQY